jgi:thioredoxin 1
MNPNFRSATVVFLALVVLSCSAFSQLATSADPDAFPPLDQWKSAVLAGDPAGLTYLYSTTPAIQVETEKGSSDASSETKFWIGLKARKIDLDILQKTSPQPGIQVVVFQADVETAAPKNEVLYVTEAQAWQKQGDSWRLVLAKRSDLAHLKQAPNTEKNIYPDNVDAHKEIKEAEERAARQHKRVLLVFGANWCYDCHVLDLAFHRPDFAPVMAGYEVVHVDIGPEGKKNNDLARQFQVPLEKGVPALAVIESDGKLVVSQKNGEFENARAMTPEALLEFLNKWKADHTEVR